jgi:hypothetical protein
MLDTRFAEPEELQAGDSSPGGRTTSSETKSCAMENIAPSSMTSTSPSCKLAIGSRMMPTLPRLLETVFNEPTSEPRFIDWAQAYAWSRERIKMRRSGRMMEIKDSERFLAEAQVGRLGTSIKNQPYVTPVNFVYQNGRIYFHCAKEGKKLSNITGNNRVCFEVDEFLGVKGVEEHAAACSSSTYFRSVVAFGYARIIKSIKDKRRILKKLVTKHLQLRTPVFNAEKIEKTTIVEIRISQITGKQNLPETINF